MGSCIICAENTPGKVLNWSERLAVLTGVAKAVHFLHTGVIPGFFNNRLKTNNILLDEHRIAKLSDYGLSIVSEEISNIEVWFLMLMFFIWCNDLFIQSAYDFVFFICRASKKIPNHGKCSFHRNNILMGSDDIPVKILSSLILYRQAEIISSLPGSILTKSVVFRQMTKLEDDVFSFGFLLLESLVGSSVSANRRQFLREELVKY